MEYASIIVYHEHNIIEIKSSYDTEYIREIKLSVPRELRMWDCVARAWKVYDVGYLPEIQGICNKYYSKVTVNEIWPVSTNVNANKFEKLYLLLSSEDKKALYKALALRVHPDRGGNVKTMQLVNEIFK
jgi:hypothetical protein